MDVAFVQQISGVFGGAGMAPRATQKTATGVTASAWKDARGLFGGNAHRIAMLAQQRLDRFGFFQD
jgi:hypothetical protein